MLFSPKWEPNLKKYILWYDLVHLTDSKYFIHEQYSYDAHDDIIQSNQHVVLTRWEFYFLSVTKVSFLPYYLP